MPTSYSNEFQSDSQNTRLSSLESKCGFGTSALTLALITSELDRRWGHQLNRSLFALTQFNGSLFSLMQQSTGNVLIAPFMSSSAHARTGNGGALLVCAQKDVYFIYSHGIGVHKRALQLSSLANIRHC